LREVKFLADAMLGRLARWLRFLGFDVVYLKDVEDSHLVRIARAEGRILLTRDRGIPARFKVPCVLINSEQLHEQLKQLIALYPPDGQKIGTRCLLCNTLLQPVKKEEIIDKVPEYILHNHKKFFRCTECERVYWEGSHMKKLQGSIDEILQKYL